MTYVEVRFERQHLVIDDRVFVVLLGNSPARGRVTYSRALEAGSLTFKELLGLAKTADVPYTLLFGTEAMALSQTTRQTDMILSGVSKKTLSLNSRSAVSLEDVALIVKDLVRKQEVLKRLDDTLLPNDIVGMLKGSRRSLSRDADQLRSSLGFTVEELQATRGKTGAFEFMVEHLEARQILVSQSQQNVMLQQLPRGRSFSGLTVRDAKVPYIFVTGGEEDSRREPAGRRVLTLALLTALIARAQFRVVTFDSKREQPFARPEWALAEEVLMPEGMFVENQLRDLDEVKAVAATFRVTPSACVMRARRLEILTPDAAAALLVALRAEYAQAQRSMGRSPALTVAIRRYAGNEFAQRMLRQLDRGKIGERDFCRVVALNRIRPHQLNDFRAELR